MVNKQYSVTRSNSNDPIQIGQPELGNLFRQSSSCNNAATPSAATTTATTHNQYYKNITDYPLNLNAEHEMKMENVEIVLGKRQDKNINSDDLQYEKRNLDKFEYVLQMDREMVANPHSCDPNFITSLPQHNNSAHRVHMKNQCWNLFHIFHSIKQNNHQVRMIFKFLVILILLGAVFSGLVFFLLMDNNVLEKGKLIINDEELPNTDDYPDFLLEILSEEEPRNSIDESFVEMEMEMKNRDDVHSIDGTNFYYLDDSEDLDQPYNSSNDPIMTSILPAKVSPTIPMVFSKTTITTKSSSIPSTFDPGLCMSVSLNICQGIQQYDLTTTSTKRHLDETELETFQYLFSSKCSKRAAEFVCSILEPECRPTESVEPLRPCKRICKSILESCADIIGGSMMLSTLFDCDQYPDSFDANVCEDPTRRSKCYTNEFRCSDLTCIPKQWKCDNIKDCSTGDDEENCKFCGHEEFRCTTSDECIPDSQRCNNHLDCSDGSDEDQCQHHQSFNNTGHNGIILLTNIQNDNTAVPDAKYNSGLDAVRPHDDNNETGKVQGQRPKGFMNLANFQESKEIMMTSSSEDDFKYSHVRNNTKPTELCPADQLRCVSGKCITVDALCDKIQDCPDGTDEAMCVYKN